MKNKKIIITSLGAILLSSSLTTSVQAEQTKPTEPSTAKSKAKVSLTPGNTEKPVDPVDPLDPTDPENPGTGNTGDLTIDFVRNLDFGSNVLTGSLQKIANINKQTYVQVTDKRGTGAGWKLTVKGSEMKTSDNSRTLTGAAISFPVGTATSKDPTNTSAPTLVGANVTLDAASADQPIMTADKNKGLGTWTDKMNFSDIKLSVPSNAYVGEYTTSLTWTLTNSETA